MRETDIDGLRREIDQIDTLIIRLLADRTDRVEQIHALKQLAGLPRRSPEREQEILDHLCSLGRRHGLKPDFIRWLFTEIFACNHRASRRTAEYETQS